MAEGVAVIVLEVVVPGVPPSKKEAGRTPCTNCDEWCWLGTESLHVVQSGEAYAICEPCAVALVKPESKFIGNVDDDDA